DADHVARCVPNGVKLTFATSLAYSDKDCKKALVGCANGSCPDDIAVVTDDVTPFTCGFRPDVGDVRALRDWYPGTDYYTLIGGGATCDGPHPADGTEFRVVTGKASLDAYVTLEETTE